jgi:hypothetical protein
VIIGNPLSVDLAIYGIDKAMNEYVIEIDAFPWMTKE